MERPEDRGAVGGERGAHVEWLAKGGRYARLDRGQFAGGRPEVTKAEAGHDGQVGPAPAQPAGANG